VSYKIIPFGKNFHPEFEGWIAEEGKGVWISFIISKEEGKGNFVRFLNELKEKYEWIKIPTPSIRMIKIALRNGFKLKKEFFGEPFNEVGKVLIWKKCWQVKKCHTKKKKLKN